MARYQAMKSANLVTTTDTIELSARQIAARYAHWSESHVKELVEGLNDDLFEG